MPLFDTVLIANRGEIACRIIKTAKALGLRTVAVYSSVDKDSLHVHMADTACYLGEAPAKESYLHIEKIIQIAKAQGAQAVHPGYGFLSENAHFARACAHAGLVFVGPGVHALESMASKQLSKQLLEKTNVPLTPGYHGEDQSESTLLEAASRIGYPVLIKAANGGGGKGMRTVQAPAEFSQALASAKREAQASFGDEKVILEKLIHNARHIEVQIMADNHGNVIHLFERDCSVQRRHQKIIEEAPAPGLSQVLRDKLTAAACAVAKSIDYRGAGTVEFLVDAAGNFYFMEMNTRLQVEHPVTECITGLDLVALQFSIAAGAPLPEQAVTATAQGHAIECRIYAEDPFQAFVPSIGTIDFLKEPTGEGVRLDSGIALGSAVSMYYDPMLAKLITFGTTRAQALHRMQAALRQYAVGGVKTNIPFLLAVCAHTLFVNARVCTSFLEEVTCVLPTPDKDMALLMAVGFDYLKTRNAVTDPLLQETLAWQTTGPASWIQRYVLDAQREDVVVTPCGTHDMTATWRGKTYALHVQPVDEALTITVAGHRVRAYVKDYGQALCLFFEQGPATVKRFHWGEHSTNRKQQPGQLTAPMPATVVAILKNIGDAVKAGERLVVLEAMKMEHSVHAPSDGMVSAVYFDVGAQVTEGAQLLAVDAPSRDGKGAENLK